MPHVKRLTRAEVEWIGFHKAFLDMYALIDEGTELSRVGQRIGGEHFAEKSLGFPAERLQQIIAFSREYFTPFLFECKQYDAIIKLMAQDKKNSGDDIAVLALRRIGEPIIINVSRAQLRNAFDFYREVIGG